LLNFIISRIEIEAMKEKLTYQIIGCAMKVHTKLGPGFQEVLYQRCLAIEFRKSDIVYAREQEQTIYYDEAEVGTRRADFVVDGKVVVEIKAVVKIEDVHIAPAKNYTVAYDFPFPNIIRGQDNSANSIILKILIPTVVA